MANKYIRINNNPPVEAVFYIHQNIGEVLQFIYEKHETIIFFLAHDGRLNVTIWTDFLQSYVTYNIKEWDWVVKTKEGKIMIYPDKEFHKEFVEAQ